MNIEVEDRQGIKVALFDGELVGGEDSDVIDRVTDLLDSSPSGVVIVLAQVPFITSAGLNELVQLASKANIHQQRVVLASPAAFVRGVLEATKLDKFFDVYATLDEAVSSLQ